MKLLGREPTVAERGGKHITHPKAESSNTGNYLVNERRAEKCWSAQIKKEQTVNRLQLAYPQVGNAPERIRSSVTKKGMELVLDYGHEPM